MMIDRLEKYGPSLSAILGGIASLTITWTSGMTTVPTTLIATAATFGIVMAGFSATQRNMLFSMRGSRVIRRAIEINQMDRVLSYLSKSSYVGIGLTLFSFAGFFVSDHIIVVLAWMTVLGALVLLAVAFLVRNEVVASLILKRYLEERTD